jgi:hypothetical protein
VWRAVQAQRVVINQMSATAKVERGVRREFFIHSRWLILNLIFLKLKPELGNEMLLAADEIGTISQRTQEYAELLWAICEILGYVSRRPDIVAYDAPRGFKAVFGTAADCARLRNAMLASLNQKQTPVTSAEGESKDG